MFESSLASLEQSWFCVSSALVVPPEVKPPDLAALVEKTLQRGQRASSWKPKLKEKKVMPYFCRLSNIKAEGKKCSAEKSHPRTPERPPGGGGSHGLCGSISRCRTEGCQPRSSSERQTKELLNFLLPFSSELERSFLCSVKCHR